MLAREVQLGESAGLTVTSHGRHLAFEIATPRVDSVYGAVWEELDEADCRRLVELIEEHLS
jgi:hypothetical protein